jgi:membrane protease subunit HflK
MQRNKPGRIGTSETMTEESYQDKTNGVTKTAEKRFGENFDAAGKSLSEALRTSFIILKIIMIALVIIFLISGFKTVGPDEQAFVLLFGRIRGTGEGRILGPGLHWTLPYPIEEIVKITVAKKVNLAVDTFWYLKRKNMESTLDAEYDGYCIVRGQKQRQGPAASNANDYNIVHSKWILTYKIDDPERFFQNIYVEDKNVKPGEIYAEVITQSITPLLESLIEDSVVTAMVNFTIDEAILSKERIPRHVESLLQAKLNRIESGIKVVSVQLSRITWPQQVDYAFQASIQASQAKRKAVTQAESYARKLLIETAGPVAEELLEVLQGEKVSKAEEELLWGSLAGKAQETISDARAYRIKVVETAKADAEYLQKILPEYRKNRRLVIQGIYQDAVEYVSNNADEKIIVQPADGIKAKEFRLLINRDPSIKPKTGREKKEEAWETYEK